MRENTISRYEIGHDILASAVASLEKVLGDQGVVFLRRSHLRNRGPTKKDPGPEALTAIRLVDKGGGRQLESDGDSGDLVTLEEPTAVRVVANNV